MRPFDPRLLRYARTAWVLFAAQLCIGIAQTASIIGSSWYLSHAIVAIFRQHATVPEIQHDVFMLALWLAVRVAATLFGDMYTARAAQHIVHEIRVTALEHLDVRQFVTGEIDRSSVTTTLGHGLRALETYFRTFVPQLVLSACATPILFIVILREDVTSAIVLAVTLPLIPVFMVLVGWYTQSVQTQLFQTLRRLSAHFGDVVGGLSTLRIFRRAFHQRQVIADVSERYRLATMKVLRVSFLSGFVLELASTLAVAVVAVGIGLRLVNDQMSLVTGLFVLLLAPEVFLPLRNVGGAYHAAAEGIEAANSVFALMDRTQTVEARRSASPQQVSPSDRQPVSEPLHSVSSEPLEVRHLNVRYDDTQAIENLSLSVPSSALTVIRGASGSGKTSLINALMGFVPATGSVNGVPLDAPGSAAERRGKIAWLGQGAPLVPGSVAENMLLGSARADHSISDITRRRLERVSELACNELPMASRIDERDGGVSGGEQRRIALARAYMRALECHTPWIVLDEPTSGIDAATVSKIIEGWETLAAAGYSVVVVSHETAVWERAHELLTLETPHTASVTTAAGLKRGVHV